MEVITDEVIIVDGGENGLSRHIDKGTNLAGPANFIRDTIAGIKARETDGGASNPFLIVSLPPSMRARIERHLPPKVNVQATQEPNQ